MDSDLLRALCALATFGVPLGIAWWIAGRRPQERGRQPPPKAAGQGVSPRRGLRSDI